MKPRHHLTTQQRGMATIAVTLMLVGVIVLGIAFTHRALSFEQKSTGNQYRATQAFEAAEAGLEWATALLNSNTAVDANCKASNDAEATPFRDRYLDITPLGALNPRTYLREGKSTALQSACVQTTSGWACSCPTAQAPQLPDAQASTAFVVQIEAGETQRLVRLTSIACIGSGTPCVPGHSGKPKAQARVQVTLGRTQGLATEPGAAVTVRGKVDAPDARFDISNEDSASGITVHSGEGADAPSLKLASHPGAPGAASLFDHDSELAGHSAETFFASVFHMSKDAWKSQPVARQVTCDSACDAALQATIGAHTLQPLIWLDKGLRIDQPATLGTPERPVMLVVDGPVQLNAAVTVHGAIYSTHAGWADPAGSSIHGALMFEHDLKAIGTTRIQHDAVLLQTLRNRTGTFARVPGSWRDF